MTLVVFLAAVLGVSCVVGLPVALHPTLGHLSISARASLAWASGSLILTMILTLLSAVGLKWTPWLILTLGVPAFVASVWMLRRDRAMTRESPSFGGFSGGLAIPIVTIIGGASLFSFVVGAATSADLSYFWGVKAVHFALTRGIEFDLLQQVHMIHLHPNYPPLWPVLLGWGIMIASSMPWFVAPSLTWVCLTAAAVVIFSVIEARLGGRAASVIACLWYLVLSTMTVTSFSGGNADGPLVMFLSIALIVILAEPEDGPRHLRWLAALALAGATFTKSEGAVAATLIVAGTAARDLLWRRRTVLRQTISLVAPAVGVSALWAAVRIAHDLPLSDPIREAAFQVSFDHIGLIVLVSARFLTTGVVAVGWLVPLISLLIARPKRLTRALPGIVTAFGIPLFAVIYYLHAVGNPLELIVWTFPRLIQPALSAWILGLGIASFSVIRESETPLEQSVTS